MAIEDALFATATVMALRCATATDEQLEATPPSLKELNVDLAECTEHEITELETLVADAWRRRRAQRGIGQRVGPTITDRHRS